jgi:transcriptional regulator with XRE-family HTH domain
MDDSLGSRLRTLRRSRGLSMRAMTKQIGLSAHSNLADYESGRRIPPLDIVAACERVLEIRDGELIALRKAALVAREHTEPDPGVRLRRTRPLLAVAASLVLVALAVALYAFRPEPAMGVSSCDRTAEILDSVPLTSATTGEDLGTVSLRYSPSCSLGWTRFIPSRTPMAGATGVVLSVHRVSDGASTDLPLRQVVAAESDPLLTVPGCVYAQATVTFSDGATASARTQCRQQ